jgi:hypothetical protein
MANETSTKAEGETLAEMKRSSQELKQRIEELRRKTEMPVNASLGNPQIDAENADGRNDLPDGDDD